ncbi:short chain dehydrogenase/reductase [Xylogone sp. PMI_703]|nr:short chain dehydrogenase/reductase [Xylogone sp. PMI_703]
MASNPVFKEGNVALITGGASGIGYSLAKKCVGYGMKVVVADNNSSNLEAAQSTLSKQRLGSTTTVQIDVGKLEDWDKLKKLVTDEFNGKIDLLALNAGIGLRGTWGDVEYFQRIMAVNLFGVINGLNTFVPLIEKTSTALHPASIIITGSKQGITNPPGNAAYNASKSAVKTLAEHLSFDLSKSSPSTSVHLLVPGWTFTGLSGHSPFAKENEAKQKPAGAWYPDQVVDYLEEKMKDGKFYVICPDNDVAEETDKKRMLWAVGDIIEGRPPLTRWREDWKAEAAERIANTKI